MASETMIQNAKAFLQQESPDSKLNLYDHLCSVMHKILENRTPNSVDLLESLSKEVKTNKFAPAGDPSSVSLTDFKIPSQFSKQNFNDQSLLEYWHCLVECKLFVITKELMFFSRKYKGFKISLNLLPRMKGFDPIESSSKLTLFLIRI